MPKTSTLFIELDVHKGTKDVAWVLIVGVHIASAWTYSNTTTIKNNIVVKKSIPLHHSLT